MDAGDPPAQALHGLPADVDRGRVLGKTATEDDLKSYVKKNLANFKVPREFEFIDELPRNATGKVLKRELVEGEEQEAGKK